MKKKILITAASLAALGALSCGMLCSYTSTKGVRK